MRISIKDPTYRDAVAEKKKKKRKRRIKTSKEKREREICTPNKWAIVRFHLIHRHLSAHIFSDIKYNESQMHISYCRLSDKNKHP